MSFQGVKKSNTEKKVRSSSKKRKSLVKELKNVISSYTNNKLVSAGITYETLKTTFQKSGRDAIVQMLTHRNSDNKPLIKKRDVIDKLCKHLAESNF